MRTSCWSFEVEPAVVATERSGVEPFGISTNSPPGRCSRQVHRILPHPVFRPFFLTAARNEASRSSCRLSAMVARKR